MTGQLASFGAELAECTGVSQVLDVVARRAAAVVGEGSVLALVAADRTMLEPTAFHHDDPCVLAAMRAVLQEPYRIGVGVAGSVATTLVPARLDATRSAEVQSRLAPQSRQFVGRHPIRALMVVPIVAYGEVFGTLGVMRLEVDEPYSDEALFALEALADRAALTIAEAQRSPHRLSAADFEAIYRHSVDGVLFTQPDGRILAANPAACQILRRSERDICLTGRAGLVVEDDRARAAIAARAATGYARSELKMRRGDGTEFVADVSSNVFTNEAGEVRACVTFRDITDQVSLRAELQEKTALLDRLVREDELTKLHNRRGFGEQAAQAFAIADRDDVPIQLVFLDVDGLKCINDGLGHDAGDEALERLAAAIRAETRASDVAARLGGDEFVVLLYGATPDLVESTMGRILRACREMADGRPAVRFSYGVVTRASGAPTSLDHLLHEADQRMYLRKANRGRAN